MGKGKDTGMYGTDGIKPVLRPVSLLLSRFWKRNDKSYYFPRKCDRGLKNGLIFDSNATNWFSIRFSGVNPGRNRFPRA